MAKVINCKLCGCEVVTHGSRTLYCTTCAKTVDRERKKQYALKNNVPKEVRIPVHVCDSPERIALCLSCTRKTCAGTCEELRTLRKKK